MSANVDARKAVASMMDGQITLRDETSKSLYCHFTDKGLKYHNS